MTTFTDAENVLIDEYYSFIGGLTVKAGKVVTEGFYKSKNVEYKTANFDVVTEYDRRCEDLLIQEISRRYPHHK